MKKQIHLSECPSCQADLHIRRLECGDCGLALEGDFAQDPLFKLNAEDLHFVRLFLHCEGSIRDLEKALGISYPTVKARLANVKSRLNLIPDIQAKPSSKAGPGAEQPASQRIIDQLENGEVDFATALAALKKEGK